MIRLLSITAVFIASAIGSAGASDAESVEAGESVFKKCAACHQVGESAKSRSGPILNGIVGAAAAQRDDFKYSNALAEAGLTWDEATLSAFLAKPKDVVPRTRMAFAGLRDEAEIANVIAFLATFNADGTRN